MLEYLNIENFKSLKKVSFNFPKITIIIGANRSGKSSVFQSLAVLKQSVDSNDISWAGKLANLGTFDNVVNNQTDDKEISIQFGGYRALSSSTARVIGAPVVHFGFRILAGHAGMKNIGYRIDCGRMQFDGMISNTEQGKNAGEISLRTVNYRFVTNKTVTNPVRLSGSSGVPASMSTEEQTLLEDSIHEVLDVFRNQLNTCYFVPTARGFDTPSFYLHDQFQEIPMSEGLSRQAEYAASNMAYKREIERKISKLVNKVLPDVEDISHILMPQKRIQITSRDEYGEYSILNEGFGLNQLVYLFYQVVTAPKSATLLIEEPEIALHPSAQASLSSVLVETSKEEDKQLIIVTHSEHVLLSFLAAVASGKLSANDLRVYYFEKEGGLTKVSEQKVGPKGELQGGLKGFFEVDMEHLRKFLSD